MKWIFLLLFGSVGLAAFIGGGVWGYQRFMLYHEGVVVTGTVTDSEYSSDSYYPVVEFTTGEGKTVRFRGSTGTGGSPEYDTGTQLEVVYNPANPAEAEITEFSQFWLGPLAIGIFGFLFLVAGIGAFFLIRSSDKTFGSAFHQMMAQASLAAKGSSLRLKGTVKAVKPAGDGRFVVVCRTHLPNSMVEELFESAPIIYDPGHAILGKPVEILVDPFDKRRYAVELEALLAQINR